MEQFLIKWGPLVVVKGGSETILKAQEFIHQEDVVMESKTVNH